MKKLGPKLAILVGILIFVVGSGTLVWFLVLSPGARAEAPPGNHIQGKCYEIEPFTTNLADEGSRRILRISLELLIADDWGIRQLDQQKSEVRSDILALLRSRYLADLEGETGMSRLAADIADRVNTILGRQSVLKVYFTDFIIQ